MPEQEVRKLPVSEDEITFFVRKLGQAIAQANIESAVAKPVVMVQISEGQEREEKVALPEWLERYRHEVDNDGKPTHPAIIAFIKTARIQRDFAPGKFRTANPPEPPPHPRAPKQNAFPPPPKPRRPQALKKDSAALAS